MRYRVIQFTTISALVSEINDYIKAGWKCQGGISTTPVYSGEFFYVQAVVHD